MDGDVEVGGEAPNSGDWSTWLQNVAEKGLTRKWDIEYLQKLQPAAQAPSTAAVSGGTQQPQPPAKIQPWMVFAGIGAFLAAGTLVYIAVKS